MTENISELERYIANAIEALDDIEAEQDESSDEGNEQTIDELRQMLEDAQAKAGDIVP